MSYERLTVKDTRTGKCERVGDPTTSAVYYTNDRFGKFSLDEEVKTKRISFKESYNRLAELEDMIESGLLVELPCKVGESVYHIRKDFSKEWFVQEEKVNEIAYDGKYFYVSWGSTREFYLLNSRYHYTFTTEEAAEAKLKELKGEEWKKNN